LPLTRFVLSITFRRTIVAYAEYGTKSVAGYANDACAAEPRRQPSALIALKELDEVIASLGSTADALLARLNGVMSDRPRAAGNVGDSPPASCALENAIAQNRRSVSVIQQQLQDALERLEV
jgi:hypothetical protein